MKERRYLTYPSNIVRLRSKEIFQKIFKTQKCILKIFFKKRNVKGIIRCSVSFYPVTFAQTLFSGFLFVVKVKLQEEQIDPLVVDDILDFMYTGSIKLTEKNDLAIVTAADFLILPDLCNLAIKSLELRLNQSTCFSLLRVAEHLNNMNLKQQCLNIIKKSLAYQSTNEEFLELNFGQVDVTLSEEIVQACKHETLFEALTCWTKHSPERVADFVNLFKHIDLKAVNLEFLRSNIATSEFVQRNEQCTKQVEDVLSIADDQTDIYSPTGNMKAFFVKINENDGLFYLPAEDMWLKKRKLNIPRCLTGENWNESRKIISYDNSIYLLDPYPIGECKFYSYHIENDMTVQLEPPPYVTPNYTGVVVDNVIYVLGKRGMTMFQRFKVSEKKWDTIKLKDVKRNCQTLVTDGDYIFTVGGTLSSGEASNTVNRYEPKTDTWNTLPPMIEAVHSATSFASNGYISVYDSIWQIYGPYANQWFDLTEKGKYFKHQQLQAVHDNIWEVDGAIYLFCLDSEDRNKCCFAIWDVDCIDWRTTSIVSIPWNWKDDIGVYCCGPVLLSRKFLRDCEVEEVTLS